MKSIFGLPLRLWPLAGATNFASILRTAVPRRWTAQATAIVLVLLALTGSAPAASLCIDYQYYPRTASLRDYDMSILSPYAQADLSTGHARGKKFYAYISAGEVARSAQYYQQAVAAGVPFLSENPNWASMVVDLRSPNWAPFVINALAAPAVAQGYDGFFLDTMDSYYLTPSSGWGAQEAGLVYMVRQLRAAYPNKQIIINRGFPVFSQLRDVVDGVLTEGLFYSYPGAPQESGDTKWLLNQLEPIHRTGMPIYIVDYVGQATAKAAQVARDITALGFIPCVVGQELDGTVLAPAPSAGGQPVEEEPALERTTRLVRIQRLPLRDGLPTMRFRARKGIEYIFEYTDNRRSGVWQTLEEIPAQEVTHRMDLKDYTGTGTRTRVYRLLKVVWR